MCGKFQVQPIGDEGYFPDGFADWLRRHPEVRAEILPSQPAPVLTAQGLLALRFGVKTSFTKRLLINARSETAASSPLFGPRLKTGRCLAVAPAFYEWSADKKPHLFALPGGGPLYMAGLMFEAGEQPGFVILTREAEGIALEVHPRMPLILGSQELREAWLRQDRLAESLLHFPAEALHPALIAG